MEDKIFNSI